MNKYLTLMPIINQYNLSSQRNLILIQLILIYLNHHEVHIFTTQEDNHVQIIINCTLLL